MMSGSDPDDHKEQAEWQSERRVSEESGSGSEATKAQSKCATLPKKILTYVIVPVFIVYGLVALIRDLHSVSQSDDTIVTDRKRLNRKFDGRVSREDIHIGYSQRIKEVVLPPSKEREIKGILANIVDVDSPVDDEGEMPFFWEIGGRGGGVPTAVNKCVPIDMALSMKTDGPGPSLERLDPLPDTYGTRIDVDMSNLEHVEYAQKHGMISNTEVGFVASPFLLETAGLFTSKRKGRIFGTIPNLGISLRFEYTDLQTSGLFDGSLLDFVTSDHILANNYVTRLLSGKWDESDEVTSDDYDKASYILKKKFVLFSKSDEKQFFNKMVEIYGWNEMSLQCMYPAKTKRDKKFNKRKKERRKHKRAKVKETITQEEIDLNNEIANAISEHNKYDLKLFELAKESKAFLEAETDVVHHSHIEKHGLAAVLQGAGTLVRYGLLKGGS